MMQGHRWYWAIFEDEQPPKGDNTIRGELVSQWFDTIEEAQRAFRRYGYMDHRIHGVLRGDDD